MHIATGGGKTFVANNVVAKWLDRHGGYALWVTKDWRLLGQAAEDMAARHCLGGELGRLGGGRNVGDMAELPELRTGIGVLYTTLHTFKRRMSRRRLPRSAPTLIVWDECHWGYAGATGKALLKWAHRRSIPLLGLTATPRRPRDFRQPCSHTFEQLVELGHLVPYELETRPTGTRWSPRRLREHGDFTPASLRQLAKSRARNKLIVDEYCSNADRYGKTIIFACDIEHANALTRLLGKEGILARISHQPLGAMTKLLTYPMVAESADGLSDHRLRWPRPRRSFGSVCAHATSTVGPAMLSVASTHTEPKSSAIIAATGEKCGLVSAIHSQMTASVREEAFDRFADDPPRVKVLVNVEQLTHGVDIPSIQTVFLCRPTASETLFWQMVGRGARRMPGKEMFHLVQFIDKPDRFNPDLVTPARTRKGQTRPNRPWKHAFDPRGLPESTGADVAEALRHLWYINGQTFGVEFELAAPHVDPDQVADNEWFRRARGLLDHLRGKLGRSKIVANSAVRRDYHYGGYKRWKVEYDSSAGWEVISPVLEGIDGLKELATACDALTDAAEDLDLYPDHRTGTHVHLGWRVKPNHVVRAIQLTHLLEPILRTLVAPSRFAYYDDVAESYDPATPNEFCVPVSTVYDIDELGPETTLEDLKRMADRNGGREATLNATPLWHDGRNKGQVEIRLHSGTTEAVKLLPWISLWMRILWAAGRPAPDLGGYDLADPSTNFPDLHIKNVLDVVALPDEDRRFVSRLRQRQVDMFKRWQHRDLRPWLRKPRRCRPAFTPEPVDISRNLRMFELDPCTGRFVDLDAEAQECAVWSTLLGEGPLPKESRETVLLAARRLRKQGWCEYQRLHENSALYKAIRRALDTATRQDSVSASCWFDIPYIRYVRAFVGVEATRSTPAKARMDDGDWRHCVLRTLVEQGGGVSRAEAGRATFETARSFYGIQLEYFVNAVSIPIEDAIDGLVGDGYIASSHDDDRLMLVGEIGG